MFNRNGLMILLFALIALSLVEAFNFSTQIMLDGQSIDNFENSMSVTTNTPYVSNTTARPFVECASCSVSFIPIESGFEGFFIYSLSQAGGGSRKVTNITISNLTNFTSFYMKHGISTGTNFNVSVICAGNVTTISNSNFNRFVLVRSALCRNNLTIRLETGGSETSTLYLDDIRTYLNDGTNITYMYPKSSSSVSHFIPNTIFTTNDIVVKAIDTGFNGLLNMNKTITYSGNEGVSAATLGISYAAMTGSYPSGYQNTFKSANGSNNISFSNLGFGVSYAFENFTGSILSNITFIYSMDGMEYTAFNKTIYATNRNVSILFHNPCVNLSNTSAIAMIVMGATATGNCSNQKNIQVNITGTWNAEKYIYPFTSFHVANLTAAAGSQIDINSDNTTLLTVASSQKPFITSFGALSNERHRVYNNTSYFKTYPYTPIGIRTVPMITYYPALRVGLWNYYDTVLEYTLSEPEFITQFYDTSYGCYEMAGLSYSYNISALHYVNTAYCSSGNSSTSPTLPVFPIEQACYYNVSDENYRMYAKFLTQQPFYAYYINQSNDTNVIYSGTNYSFSMLLPVNSSVREMTLQVNYTVICSYTNESMFGIPSFELGNYSSVLTYPLFIGLYVLSVQFPYVSILLFVLNDAFELMPLAMLFPLVMMLAIFGSAINTDTRQSLRAMVTYAVVIMGYLIMMFGQFPVMTVQPQYYASYQYVQNYVGNFTNATAGIVTLSTTPDNAANWLLSAATIAGQIIVLPAFISSLMSIAFASIHPTLAEAWTMFAPVIIIAVYVTIALKFFTILMNQYDKEDV